MEQDNKNKIVLIDTTLHRKLISQTYKFKVGEYTVSCTHIFEYDEIGEYYFEDFIFDIPKEIDYYEDNDIQEDIREEIKEFINNL